MGDVPSPLLPQRLFTTLDAFVSSRARGADEDVHMVPEIVDEVIRILSAPGDLVLDPFAGFGTTLQRAVLAGRDAVGVELLPERVDHVRCAVPTARVVEGDARELLAIAGLEKASVALVLCSPPYMTATHHDADPLTAYELDGGNYARYLREVSGIAAQCAYLLKPGGYQVWNVANIFHKGIETRLIDDCAVVLSRHLAPVAVIDIEWDTLPHDLTRDALLVFRREHTS